MGQSSAVMATAQLAVQQRKETGKVAMRKLRAAGKVPGVCYGLREEPIAVSFEEKSLLKVLDPVKGRNTLLHLRIQGDNEKVIEVPALLKEVQRDALRGHVTHVDFIRVDVTRPVLVTVPLVFSGKPEGVKNGGNLHQEVRNLVLYCLPNKIPNSIEVDVRALDMGDSIHVSDLKLEDGITVALAAGTTLCVVTAPKEEKAAAAPATGVEAAATAPAATSGEAKDDKNKAAPKGK